MTSTAPSLELLQRRTHRITITVPDRVHRALNERADSEGRSLSNLTAFLIERSLDLFEMG
jgi:predicted HicB family RNase H-like nuclease